MRLEVNSMKDLLVEVIPMQWRYDLATSID